VFSLPDEPGDNAQHERTCRFITDATGQDGDEGIGEMPVLPKVRRDN
jgi:hypothetical protein